MNAGGEVKKGSLEKKVNRGSKDALGWRGDLDPKVAKVSTTESFKRIQQFIC